MARKAQKQSPKWSFDRTSGYAHFSISIWGWKEDEKSMATVSDNKSGHFTVEHHSPLEGRRLVARIALMDDAKFEAWVTRRVAGSAMAHVIGGYGKLREMAA